MLLCAFAPSAKSAACLDFTSVKDLRGKCRVMFAVASCARDLWTMETPCQPLAVYVWHNNFCQTIGGARCAPLRLHAQH